MLNAPLQSSPLAFDVVEAARLASLSPNTIRKAIKSGKLRAARIGTSLRITREWLESWLRDCSDQKENVVRLTEKSA